MTNIDVALRLRLDYQKRGADEAERDLKEIKQAADQIGRSRGGDQLNQDIRSIGRSADDAKQKIAAIGAGFNGVAGEAKEAASAVGRIKTEADQARQAVASIDNGAFAGLKSDAASAKAAIAEIGQAADVAQNKIRQIRPGYSTMTTGGGRLIADGHWRPGGGMMSSAEGALDQFGVPLALGAGGAYLAGAVPAGLSVAGGAAVRAAANDEQRSDALRVTGEYDAAEQTRIDRLLETAGRRYGVGTAKAQETFGTLISNGVDAKDAATMTDRVIRVGKATSADPVDVASSTVSLRQIMGITPSQMTDAYESIAVGGKMGRFEVKDMANHGPSLFAAMANQGSTGLDGVRLTTAIAQSIAQKSGSNDQAKTSFEAMLNDMVSPDVAERFKKDYGKDIYEIRKEAIAAGKDPVLESLRVYHDAVGGDEAKTRDLFRNSEAYKGYAAVFGDLEQILSRMKDMEGAGGVIDKDFETNTDNLNSQMDRLFSNLGGNIKDAAGPLLPFLTGAARAMSEAMEQAREQQQNDPVSMMPNGGMLQEGLRLWLEHTSSGRKEPSGIDRFLWGSAADPEFDLKEHFGITLRPSAQKSMEGNRDGLAEDGAKPGQEAQSVSEPGNAPEVDLNLNEPLGTSLRPSAQKSMEGYREGLAEEGAKAEQEAQSIADRIKALLGFTVSPVIAPTYAPPAGAPMSPAPGQQSSLSQGNTYNQTINSPNAKHAGRQSAREIQRAQARTLYDTGRRTA